MNIKGALDQICDTFGRIEAYAESVERQRNELLDKSTSLERSVENQKRAIAHKDVALGLVRDERDHALKELAELRTMFDRACKERDDISRGWDEENKKRADLEALIGSMRHTTKLALDERDEVLKVKAEVEKSLANMINSADALCKELGEHIVGKLDRDEKITRLEKALDDAARNVAKQATVIENLHLTLSMVTVVMASIKDPDMAKLNYAINKLLDSIKSSNGAR